MATTAPSASPLLDVPPCPRTLILDFRDSYTANLLSLFSELYPPPNTNILEQIYDYRRNEIESGERNGEWISDKVIIVQADTLKLPAYLTLLKEKQIDCVILSPGPGRADNEEVRCPIPNRTAMAYITATDMTLLRTHNYTSLFDCLPHSRVPYKENEHENGELEARGQVDLVAYNSLTVSYDNFPHDKLRITAWHEVGSASAGAEERTVDARRTIQAIEGIDRPVWGVQFHPESIASAHGAEILGSFLHKTHAFHGNPISFPKLTKQTLKLSSVYQGLDAQEPSRPILQSHGASSSQLEDEDAVLESTTETFQSPDRRSVSPEEMFIGLIDRIRNPLGQVWLDGVSTRAPTTSSIAFPSFIITYTIATRTVTCHFLSPDRHSVSPDTIPQVKKATLQFEASPEGNDVDFWNWFGRGQTALKRMYMTQGQRWKARQPSVYCGASEEEDRKPRWKGGWVGWWGYEMKAESLGGYHRPSKCDVDDDGAADACWAWCNRLVQREQDGLWTARGILGVEPLKDQPTLQSNSSDLPQQDMLSWLQRLGVQFGATRESWKSWTATCQSVLANPDVSLAIGDPSNTRMPDFKCDITAEQYLDGIRKCRDAIYAGDSYELTMTTQFRSPAPPTAETLAARFTKDHKTTPEALELYLHLRQKNPAPYSTYLSFPSVRTTILSSSPERFLRITPGGRIEMKPIKGTRARVRYPRDAEMCAKELGREPTEQEAATWCEEKDNEIGEALQNDGKERAENLMVRPSVFEQLPFLNSMPFTLY
ncbi:hypothetical protein QFC19_007636 [Naganishia cerealis]|uniref:Uncharacterized protein n=1 Tax=Naganishia cerealis TaxID=610337 RepID=A0ACC2V7A8_9TREE|nr:hypothetical protein QFC19_007636 [Naganishia cerealis]